MIFKKILNEDQKTQFWPHSEIGSDFRSKGIGENIAYNYPDAESVVKGWQESPSHCKNMMSADFNQMGAAYIDGYWVQVLGKPKTTP